MELLESVMDFEEVRDYRVGQVVLHSTQYRIKRMPRRAYPSDVTDEEWLFVSPYLTLMREDDLREVFNSLCWVVRTGPSGV